MCIADGLNAVCLPEPRLAQHGMHGTHGALRAPPPAGTPRVVFCLSRIPTTTAAPVLGPQVATRRLLASLQQDRSIPSFCFGRLSHRAVGPRSRQHPVSRSFLSRLRNRIRCAFAAPWRRDRGGASRARADKEGHESHRDAAATDRGTHLGAQSDLDRVREAVDALQQEGARLVSELDILAGHTADRRHVQRHATGRSSDGRGPRQRRMSAPRGCAEHCLAVQRRTFWNSRVTSLRGERAFVIFPEAEKPVEIQNNSDNGDVCPMAASRLVGAARDTGIGQGQGRVCRVCLILLAKCAGDCACAGAPWVRKARNDAQTNKGR